MSRISWDQMIFGMLFVMSKRSHDIQKQFGTAIVDKKHRIIGLGFNGLARGLDDDIA